MKGRPRLVVVGCSAGGLDALTRLLGPLPADFPLPVVVVAHMAPDPGNLLVELLDQRCSLAVREAEEKEPVQAGTIHIAPPGYHLLLERDLTFALSVDARVCNSRPSIDVAFESAADACGAGTIGVVLTGANSDGTLGLVAIKKKGGAGLVQDPATAEAETMPRSAIAAGAADFVGPLEALTVKLLELAKEG